MLVAILWFRWELQSKDMIYCFCIISMIAIMTSMTVLWIWGIVVNFLASSQPGCMDLYYLIIAYIVTLSVQIGLRMCGPLCNLMCAFCFNWANPRF